MDEKAQKHQQLVTVTNCCYMIWLVQWRFWNIIQQIYVLFSASTKWWALFSKYAWNISVKPLCETKLESQLESVKVVRYQAGEIDDALFKVPYQISDPKDWSEAESLWKQLKNFNFTV